MITVNDIIQYVEKLSGHPLHKDEGVHHGAIAKTLAGITVCWMATPSAITEAGKRGDDLIIGHESLYYPYDIVSKADAASEWKEWRVNKQRRELLNNHNLTFLRLHGSLDEICIFDEFARLLDLGEPVYVDGLVKVYQIEECSLEALINKVKNKTKMAHVRVSPVHGMNQKVKRIGLPWGGLGLFVNVEYQQRLIEQACDVFIAGESDNYGFRFSEECGIPMIETSHEISENPGLHVFSEMMAKTFPDLAVHFYENPCVWQCS